MREAVRALCARFPDPYWRDLDARREYPEGVRARHDGGRLAGRAHSAGVRRTRLRPPGGGGDPAGGQLERRLRRSRARPDVHHGRAAAARLRGAESALAARHRLRRAAAAGVRRHRAERRHRYDPHRDDGHPRWRRVRHHRPQDLHLPRAALRSDAPPGPHLAARRAAAHGWPEPLSDRSARGRQQHPGSSTAHDDEQRDQRVDDRWVARSGGESRRHGRRWVPPHPRRLERGTDPHCRRVCRRRPLVHRARGRLRDDATRSSAGRSAPTRGSSSRWPRPGRTSRRPT